jgi:hypothetical protein
VVVVVVRGALQGWGARVAAVLYMTGYAANKTHASRSEEGHAHPSTPHHTCVSAPPPPPPPPPPPVPQTDNKAAAERWLACLEAAGLTVVLPRDLGGAQQYSSSSRDEAGREVDGQLQDR